MEDLYENYPAVVFQYNGQFPDEELNKEDEFTENIGIKVIHLKTKSGGFLNSLDWAVPTFIVIQILKPYFESMLKEAGKEHYEILKKVLKRSLFLGKGKMIHTINKSGIIKPPYTHSISFQMQTKDDKSIKILFNENDSIEEWEDLMIEVVDLFSNNLKNHPNDRLTEMIKPFGNLHHSDSLFLVKDNKTKSILIKNSRMMLEDYKNRKDECE